MTPLGGMLQGSFLVLFRLSHTDSVPHSTVSPMCNHQRAFIAHPRLSLLVLSARYRLVVKVVDVERLLQCLELVL